MSKRKVFPLYLNEEERKQAEAIRRHEDLDSKSDALRLALKEKYETIKEDK